MEVSRQDLGRGQYRWTITFLDEGDDFGLVPQHEYASIDLPPYLSISPIDATASSPSPPIPTGLSVTTTKVRTLRRGNQQMLSQDKQNVPRRTRHVADLQQDATFAVQYFFTCLTDSASKLGHTHACLSRTRHFPSPLA